MRTTRELAGRRRPLASLVLPGIVLASACVADGEPVANIVSPEIAVCFAAIATGGEVDAAACPSFLMQTAIDASELCRDASGNARPIEAADIWRIDVNDDDRPEYAFAFDEVVYCEGAPSAFSCGSLGCPKALYGERDDGWQLLGAISAWSRDAIEVTDTVHEDGYRDLVVGCASGDECAALWLYEWQGDSYEPVSAEVRGHRVELADSVHGLFALAADTTVLATPEAGGEPLDRYAADTELAIIGTAGEYYYVSPCNACESGFVPAALIPSAR